MVANFLVYVFICKMPIIGKWTHIESCTPLVNGWRQWLVVQCRAKRSASDGTKYRSHVKWRQQHSEKI